jgi:hypothetical protein
VNRLDLLISSATQRSGSTLIQRIFNARKKTLIWGENGGCLTEFYRLYNNALQNSEEYKAVRESFLNDGQDPNQWIACMTPSAERLKHTLVQTVQDFHYELYIKEYENDFDMIGCKEVRYGKDELQLFRECFPDCPIILVIRHPVDVWKSVSRRERNERYGSPDEFCNLWNTRVNDYRNLEATDSNMHFIRFEDVVDERQDVMNLFKEMGQLNDQKIKNVLDVKIKSTSKRTPPREIARINILCEQVMLEVGYEPIK